MAPNGTTVLIDLRHALYCKDRAEGGLVVSEQDRLCPASWFYVFVFLIESGFRHGFTGQCGQFDTECRSLWHAEVVKLDRPNKSPLFILVIYLASQKPIEGPSITDQKYSEARDLAEHLTLPHTFHYQKGILRPEETVSLRRLVAAVYSPQGKCEFKEMGGVIKWGNPWEGRLEPEEFIRLKLHPELKRALMYTEWGVSAATRGQYSDACMNYVRALECILGSFKTGTESRIESECARLGVLYDDVKWLMEKVRNIFAVAHIRDKKPKERQPKLKTSPDRVMEYKARGICCDTVRAYWKSLGEPTAEERDPFRYLYDGARHLPANAPEPERLLSDLELGKDKTLRQYLLDTP